MQRQKIFLIAGVVLGVMAVLMTKVYIDQQRQRIIEEAKEKLAKIQANQTAVLVAKQEIPRGTVIGAEMLETKIVPNQYVQPQAVTSLDRITGMITVAPISEGEQITLSKLTYPRQAGGGLSGVTPVGKRAITISVDNISSLAGMVKAGDYVDVITMIPIPTTTADGKQITQAAVIPLFQNVLVLAVGQEIGTLPREEGRYRKEEKKEDISSFITLALNPQEANLIAFVQEQGKIRLTLRSPADSQVQPVQPASWDTLFQYIMPKEVAKPVTPEEVEVIEYVEIYRGLDKERVPLVK